MLNSQPNPFQVLKLSTKATSTDIIDRQDELSVGAEPEKRQLYQQAAEALNTHRQVRLLHELFEVPATHYAEENQEWDRFTRVFRRNPIRVSEEELPVPEQELIDLPALLQQLLAEMLPQGQRPPFIESSPFTLQRELPPLEVRDTICG
jgi:hypothetical protein